MRKITTTDNVLRIAACITDARKDEGACDRVQHAMILHEQIQRVVQMRFVDAPTRKPPQHVLQMQWNILHRTVTGDDRGKSWK